MRTRGVIGGAVVLWMLALTLSARAYQAVTPSAPGPRIPSRIAGTERPALAHAAVASGTVVDAVEQAGAKPSPEQPAPKNDACLACHSDDSLKRGNGTAVFVRQEAFTASVHGGLNCVDCHADLAHASEFPHPEKLARVDCAACHADEVAKYRESAHAQARQRGTTVAATCIDCHGMHDIRASRDPESRTYHLRLAQTCGKCHGNQEVITKGHIAIGDVTVAFADSIHGHALNKSGLLVAPNCSDCHGAHDIRQKSDLRSHVALANVPSTCGKCHEGIEHEFEGGVHGAVLAKGNNGAPACQTCHTAHAIRVANDPNWQLSVVNQCGSCHADKIKTYRDTFHGQVTNLGFRAVATCADCHGNHRILPASDPQSPVAPGHLVQTCGKCHANANANFVKYDPHADKHDRRRYAGLYFAARFMQVLLIGVFVFFGLHTALWLLRGSYERGARRPAPAGPRRVDSTDSKGASDASTD